MKFKNVPSGSYSPKAFCFDHLRASNSIFSSWKLVWSGLAPPKVGAFCWQLLKGKIAVKDNLVSKNILQHSETFCSFCGHPGESVNHLFFSCYGPWCIWSYWCRLWGIQWAAHKDAWSNFIEWHSLLPSSSGEIIWKISFYAILWSIWILRNEVVFKNKQLDFIMLIDLVKFRIIHWAKAKWPHIQIDSWSALNCLNKIQIPTKRVNPRPFSCWSCPSFGAVKFNIDGAAQGKPGPAGIGGILRDHQGTALIRFSKSIGTADSNLAEILTIKEAFLLVTSSRWVNLPIIFESDSMNAVSWVSNPLKVPWKFRNIISHMENLKRQLQDWKIVHIFRESNSEADSLAKEGINRSTDFLFIKEHEGVA
ncbi:hypothetical protein PTKIN_Ptkin16aG0498800 [Pterospermum kingtungense]